MAISRSEKEAVTETVARERALKNLINVILDYVRRENPELYQEMDKRIDEVLVETGYFERVRDRCADIDRMEDVVECVSDVKRGQRKREKFWE